MNLPPKLNIPRAVLTVSELNYSAKILLEQTLPLLWVKGEISNLKRYQSGHWYFSLKDASAQVRCVIFRHKNQYLDWQPKDGLQVEVRARVTLYESRGDFQLNVETIRRAGLGELFEAYEQLKSRLEKAGLFAPERKKPLPIFPKQIGIITSPATAALHDILSTLQRRMPALPVIIYPTPVQGEGAAEKIAECIHTASKHADCDVLILCRGGGSIEDLWAFNEEIVAQAIAACTIPIISGIGHETDFTIADFVADKRAPTPTGAAQLACLDSKELLHRLNTLGNRMQRVIMHYMERHMQNIDLLAHRLLHPGERIHNQHTHVRQLHERLVNAWLRQTEKTHWHLCELNQCISAASPSISRLVEQQHEWALRLHRAISHRIQTLEMNQQHQQAQLTHLNPQSVLARGYSITYTAQGTMINESNQINVGDDIQVKFAKGWCDANVSKKNNA